MLVAIQEKISLMQPSIFEICTDCIPVVLDCIPMVPGTSGLKREVKVPVICLEIEEEVVEETLGRFPGRRLTRTHHPVDLDLRVVVRGGRIDAERGGDVRAAVDVVDVEGVYRLDSRFPELREQRLVQLVVRVGDYLRSPCRSRRWRE